MVRELLKKKSNNELAKMLNLNPRILSRWKHIGNISRANRAMLRMAYANLIYGYCDISCRNMTKNEIDEAALRRLDSIQDSLASKIMGADLDRATKKIVLLLQ